ncbi:MAG: hypothetical protein KF716_18985 [Anaerolineae bacterium]|nr:hypothetical protein [Anaerolineae bacterium]
MTLIVPRLVFIGQVVMTGVLSMTIMVAVGLGRQTPVPPNPFDAYADILPEQGLRGLDAHGFVCHVRDYNYYADPAETRCDVRLETGTFSRIEVFYAGGTIKRTDFEIRENAIKVGDLVVFLGLTEVLPRGHIFFTWHGSVGLALYAKPSDRYGVFQHVSKVTLTNTPLHGREPQSTSP